MSDKKTRGVLAYFFSDPHLHTWPRHNENNRRTRAQMEFVEHLFRLAHTYNAPIFCGGDWFHTNEALTNDTLSLTWPWLIELFNIYPVKLYSISGNHDQAGTSTFDRRTTSYVNTLAASIQNFEIIDFETVEFEKFTVSGIPYISHNQDYPILLDRIKTNPKKFNILLNHTDYKNQKDVNGYVVGRGENIDEDVLTKKFDLIMSGHIHAKGIKGKIVSMGSPYQTRVSDMGGEFGFWSLTKDLRLKFHPVDNTPKFRYYHDPKEIDNDLDIWIKAIEERESNDAPSKTITDKQLRDKAGIVKSYLKFTGVKSRRKKVLLHNLLSKLEDE